MEFPPKKKFMIAALLTAAAAPLFAEPSASPGAELKPIWESIKSQCAAIYRKSGVSSRAELVSVVIEDLPAGLDRTTVVEVLMPDEGQWARAS